MFLTRDPIGFAGADINLYRYVGNNPVNRVDPEGLQSIGAIFSFAAKIAQSIFGLDLGSIVGGNAGGVPANREMSALLKIFIESDPRFTRDDLPSENMYLDTWTNAVITVRNDEKVTIYSQYTKEIAEMDAEFYLIDLRGQESGPSAPSAVCK